MLTLQKTPVSIFPMDDNRLLLEVQKHNNIYSILQGLSKEVEGMGSDCLSFG